MLPEHKVAGHHYAVLDGWRGISILLVLLGHLFPLGRLDNGVIAAMGMAIFFTLSGFLITSFLLRSPNVGMFLTRRFFRIIPLAWLCAGIELAVHRSDGVIWLAHIFFFANLPPFYLIGPTAHLWSLCLEMQFYVGIALLVAALGVRGLRLLPVLCVAITVGRVIAHEYMTIVSWFRVDEILVGCVLALIVQQHAGSAPARALGRLSPGLLLLALYASAHPAAGPLNYLRPYIAAAMVGSTLFGPEGRWRSVLGNRQLAYMATVSYALYVLHPMLRDTWLGSGGLIEKYAKRPLLMAALFAVAHVSTTQFESRCIETGRRLSTQWFGKKVAA